MQNNLYISIYSSLPISIAGQPQHLLSHDVTNAAGSEYIFQDIYRDAFDKNSNVIACTYLEYCMQ